MNCFKKVVLFLKVIVCLLAQQRFGNVIQFLRTKYTFFLGKAFGNFRNYLGVARKQHINSLTNIIKVMVPE